MANGFDNVSRRALPKGTSKRRRANRATIVVKADQNGQFYHHPQKGRIKVIALHCNCGRSILVDPKEVEEGNITCDRCNSPFMWQQLSFALD